LLAQAEIGDKIQRLDFVFTLQGLIKSVNGESLSTNGMNGETDEFAKDVFAYSLHYNKNDYTPINTAITFLDQVNKGDFATAGADLYNGNISKMATSLSGMPLLGKTYTHDELNRLVASNTFEGENLTATDKYKTKYTYDANGNIMNLERNGNLSTQLAMDRLTYHYATDAQGNKIRNRLLHVEDAVPADAYADDVDNQEGYVQNDPSSYNFKYDAIGNLIADKQAEIAEIIWTNQNKPQEIRRTAGSTKPDLKYAYDATGNRISKTEIYPTTTIDGVKETTTYYIKDFSGNTLATYTEKLYEDGKKDLFLSEQILYGSSRLGMRKANKLLVEKDVIQEFAPAQSSGTLGSKFYEMNNHLNNVMVVVSDRKIGNEAEIVAVYDYMPFGKKMAGRTLQTENYRYNFNGKEYDSETQTYDYGFRIYNPDYARFLSIDPLTSSYPWYTPYQFAGNMPIWAIDLDGLEELIITRPSVSLYNKLYTNIKKSSELIKIWNSVNGADKVETHRVYFGVMPHSERKSVTTTTTIGTTTATATTTVGGYVVNLTNMAENIRHYRTRETILVITPEERKIYQEYQEIFRINGLTDAEILNCGKTVYGVFLNPNLDEKEITFNFLHELEAHLKYHIRSNTPKTADEGHSIFYNYKQNQDLFKRLPTGESPTYQDIPENSPAGKIKAQLEQIFNSGVQNSAEQKND